MTRTPLTLIALALLLVCATPALAAPAPGGPGEKAIWTEADKDGFGTSHTLQSKVWHTLDDGRLTEVYYPDLSTPAVRDVQLVVSDGKSFSEREQDATDQRVRLLDSKALSYRQVNTDRDGLYRIVKTYTTDPARNTVMVRVRFESLTKRKLDVYVLHDPGLSNEGNDDSGASRGGGLVAWDDEGRERAALLGGLSPQVERLPRHERRLDRPARRPPHELGLLARPRRQRGADRPPAARRQAPPAAHPGARLRRRPLGRAEQRAAARWIAASAAPASAYERSWHRYLGSLERRPDSAAAHGPTYWVSLMVLAASEDKTYRGAGIASPSMPWAWGLLTIGDPPVTSDAYHLVWSRDLYQVGTALIAAGDRDGAERALDFLFERQQKPDGSFPQNSLVDGTPRSGRTCSSTRWPCRSCSRGSSSASTSPPTPSTSSRRRTSWPRPARRLPRSAGRTRRAGRRARSRRRSPASLRRRTSRAETATTPRHRPGSSWPTSGSRRWTAGRPPRTARTADDPYYLRLTKDANPNAGTTYSIGDGGPSAVDQRKVVDPSYLELVRLGVKPYDHPTVLNTVKVVDEQLGVDTPNGRFWHRFNFDGYGETATGGPWDITEPDTFTTFGRIWPIFAGERGEYELLAGRPADDQLAAMAGAANEGWMIPEQVWDENPPSGQPGFPRGEGTFSATPLAWSHAQFVRLAWSIEAGRPVEQPSIVACRYVDADC